MSKKSFSTGFSGATQIVTDLRGIGNQTVTMASTTIADLAQLSLAADGKLLFRDSGLYISSPSDAALTVVSDGTITLDATTNITLDADGGTITFSDGGSSLGTITSAGFTGNVVGNVTGNCSGTAATVTGAAQSNITSLGTLTALTVDDIALDGKVITMTGSTDDTVVLTAGTNGTLSIVTTDNAAAAANIQITADGTAELEGTTVTLDSSGDIVLSADGGNVTMDDGTTTVFDFDVDNVVMKMMDDADTGDYFSIAVAANGATTISTVDDDSNDDADLTLDADGKIVIEAKAGDEVVFNENDNDVDFRVESVNNTHMLFVDAGNNRVEIKGTTPILRIDADTDNFAKLEWAENGTRKWAVYHDHADDNLTFKQGTAAGGTDLMVITQAGGVGIGTITPKPGLTVVNDYQSTAFESILSDGECSGEVLRYSPGADDTLTAGQIYFLHTDGTWDSADADDVDDGASQLLGVGLGGSSRTVGVLIKGFIRIPSTEILNLPGSGACDGLPLYISTTAGHFDFTAPSGNNDFVRIVGYAIDDDSSDVLVHFNPDHTWVKVTA